MRVEERRVNWEILMLGGMPQKNAESRSMNLTVATISTPGSNEPAQRQALERRSSVSRSCKTRESAILTEANVRKICFDDNLAEPRATGVAVLHGGQEHVFTANNEVILAAGAIASPQLLQLSGLGASETLHQHSIATLIELPGVGENLQDHLQIRTIYSVDNTITLNQRARTPWGMALMGLEYFLRKTGPLTRPPSQLGALAHSDPSQPSQYGMAKSRCRWINLVRHCTSTTPSHHQYATYGLQPRPVSKVQ